MTSPELMKSFEHPFTQLDQKVIHIMQMINTNAIFEYILLFRLIFIDFIKRNYASIGGGNGLVSSSNWLISGPIDLRGKALPYRVHSSYFESGWHLPPTTQEKRLSETTKKSQHR